jgi:hypothetical protein
MAITRLGPNQDITAAKIAGTINFKNLIINGDMSIAQRSTSVASITTDGYYTCDRWNNSVNLGTWTINQSTDTPTGQGFANSFKMTCTTGASLSAGTQNYLNQRFEGQNLQYLKKGTANALPLTLSFWGKSATTTGTMTVELFDTDNSRQISKQISLTTSWTKYTINYDADTIGTFNNDNGASLYVIFWVSAGSNFTSGTLSETWTSNTNANRAVGQTNFAVTSTELYFTGIQLEADTSASDFEFLPVDVNLERCQRYYQILSPTNPQPIVQYQANFRSYVQTFMTQMRTAPSLTVDTFSSFAGFGGNLTTTTGVHAYYGVSYTNADSMQIQGMRLNAEL